MYGGTPLYDGISQFTFGHAADGTAPDDIIPSKSEIIVKFWVFLL